MFVVDKIRIAVTTTNTLPMIIMVRFQVLAVVRVKMTVFWDVVPCSLIEVYQTNGATSQKTVIFNDHLNCRSPQLDLILSHFNLVLVLKLPKFHFILTLLSTRWYPKQFLSTEFIFTFLDSR
jgi:hypothetical protein